MLGPVVSHLHALFSLTPPRHYKKIIIIPFFYSWEARLTKRLSFGGLLDEIKDWAGNSI